MTSATALFMLARGEHGSTPPSEGEIAQFLNELIAIHPKHPGGYDLLAKYQIQAGDHRAAMGLFRKAKEFAAPDYPGRIIFEEELRQLESKARWGEKLPAVLRGEIKPANNLDVAELAGDRELREESTRSRPGSSSRGSTTIRSFRTTGSS